MKTIYKYAVSLTVALLGFVACSSSDDTATPADKTPVAQPLVIVRELTTTAFTLRWEAVEGAASYVYTFNGGAEISTTDCQVAFTDLERKKEYVVAIKACPRNEAFGESAFTYVHVVTDDLEKLPTPKLTLGSAYATKTIVSWEAVPEAKVYEFSIDDTVYTTSECTVTMSGLEKSTSYLFAVRAMTADATRYTNSEVAELEFTTSNDDIPQLMVVPTSTLADAININVIAPSDLTYFYDAIPLGTFLKRTPEQIMTAYRQSIIKFAEDKGITLQLAMASMLKAGTKSIQIGGLMPELSYMVVVFGMNLKGEITTELTAVQVKTMPEDFNDGPNYGGSDWFNQSMFITNAYAGTTGYGWSNSVWYILKGKNVASVRYRMLPTSTFKLVFPDANDKTAITAFLKDENYSYTLEAKYLPEVNSEAGKTFFTAANPGTSYTQAVLATSSTGEETLSVNSVITKSSTSSDTWFQTKAFTNAQYGPTHNTFVGSMFGSDIVSARYALVEQSLLERFQPSDYPRIIEQLGTDVEAQYISSINGMGFAILYNEQAGIQPSTTYVFMATGVNSVNDHLTKWSSVTTTAAPANSAAKTATRTVPAGQLRSIVGECIPASERFLFPMPGTPLPSDARPEGDLWTIIHNMQILN